MKIKISFLALSFAGASLLFSETSCKKADFKTNVANVEYHSTLQSTTYKPANIKVLVGYTKGDGVPGTSSNGYAKDGYATEGDYPGCGDRAYLIDLAYNGFTTFNDLLLGQHTLEFTWTLSVPSGEIEPVTSSLA